MNGYDALFTSIFDMFQWDFGPYNSQTETIIYFLCQVGGTPLGEVEMGESEVVIRQGECTCELVSGIFCAIFLCKDQYVVVA